MANASWSRRLVERKSSELLPLVQYWMVLFKKP